MSVKDLKRFFDDHRAESSLVLATVYETAGSTYSKAGARMLINSCGDFQGMLSGGCLEGDIAEHASQVIDTGIARSATYDMRGEDDEIWGLGVGCEGMMRVFLQPLDADTDFRPFTEMLEVLEGEQVGALATVVAADDAQVTLGASALSIGDDLYELDLPTTLALKLAEPFADVIARRQSALHRLQLDGSSCDVLVSLLEPPPQVLVLGGGLDAPPLVGLCADLGWRVTVQDHRPGYIEKSDFAAADKLLCVPAAALAGELELDRFDAAVVMSHHLATDRVYLQQLAASSIGYVGLLGPAKRRRRLVADLAESTALQGRLRGPAGIDIGGRGPRSIALSIIAEVHRALMRDRESS